MSKSRISLQLQVPFGSKSASQMDARVTTYQKALVIGFSMSPLLSHSNFAFKTLVKDLSRFINRDKDAVSYILQNYAKTAARIKSVAVLKEHSATKQFQCTQHIPLTQKVHHAFATASNCDIIFYG
eukprot:13463741-Ditylum_brightwellii.AAC.1